MRIHYNNGKCEGCRKIFDRYAGFDVELRSWFEELQNDFPKVHISCAGRGPLDQEAAKLKGASKASWGESAHNWNAAIDIFLNQLALYDKSWFENSMAPRLTPNLNWYGRDGAPYYELPHIELTEWKEMAQNGQLELVK